MPARENEVRDAVHTFIDFDHLEKSVIDSGPFQRLRHIHQLALSGQVYPGASHKRFEHSLGVMHVAGWIFDVVTRPAKLNDAVRDVVPDHDSTTFAYWRTVLRIAALCHDLGHLPFSHVAEEELLPEGSGHELLTYKLISSSAMNEAWEDIRPRPEPQDVAKLALGPDTSEKLRLGLRFDPWEAILAEIIVGDFGADRIDYLLRDSLHTGVAYGRFDHHRLIQTLRILPPPISPGEEEEPTEVGEPALGIEKGGLESIEGLLLARYFMFAQVYYHHTRLIYDEHLKDFLRAWLPDGQFPVDEDGHLGYTDNEVWTAISQAARTPDAPGHDPARRIVTRNHFRMIDNRRATDVGERAIATRAVYEALRERYGPEYVRYGKSPKRGDPPDFPVRERDGSCVSSLSLSEVLGQLPVSRDEYVYVPRELHTEAHGWLKRERGRIVDEAVKREQDEEGAT